MQKKYRLYNRMKKDHLRKGKIQYDPTYQCMQQPALHEDNGDLLGEEGDLQALPE